MLAGVGEISGYGAVVSEIVRLQKAQAEAAFQPDISATAYGHGEGRIGIDGQWHSAECSFVPEAAKENVGVQIEFAVVCTHSRSAHVGLDSVSGAATVA